MASPSVLLASIFLTLGQLLLLCVAQLKVGFYENTCRNAEAVVRKVVEDAYVNQGTMIAPGLVRMHFHDCFVRGCDASVMLDGNGTEKTATPNLSLHGFDIIDAAKAKLETDCPGIVSCADILTFAARDSVFLAKGIFWNVAAGRRDGTVSRASEALKFLPSPFSNLDELLAGFQSKGLDLDDLLILSAAHTFGVAHCPSFTNRLYNFSAESSVDPTLDPDFANYLQQKCPPGNKNPNTAVPLDSKTPKKFDNAYYANLVSGRGLLTSDQILYEDPRTKETVLNFIVDPFANIQFQRKFVASIRKMGGIEVKTGNQGEVRKKCNVIL